MIGMSIAYNPCKSCNKDKCNICELDMYRKGILSNPKWISVKDMLPETKVKELEILDQDIASGEIKEKTKYGLANVSELVAVIHIGHMGGKKKQYIDFDKLINGRWAYSEEVTYWTPIPLPPNEEESDNEC